MKKALSLILILLLTLSLAACGGKQTGGPQDDGDGSDAAGIANPWVEISADDVYNNIGFRFGIPEGAKNIQYFWDEEDGIAEMRFTDIHDIDWTARAKKTESFEDISGTYYDYSGNNDNYGHGPDVYIRHNDFELRGDYHLLRTEDDDHVNLGLWFYEGAAEGYNYSLSLCHIGKDGFYEMQAGEVFPLEGAGGEDPVQYGQGYWEEKYPGYNICPFSIEVNGTYYPYYWATGYQGNTGDIAEWVETDFNWNGWHMVGDYIVNEDETYRITDDSRSESFSSCCSYYTEPFDPNAVSEQEDHPAGEETAYDFKGYTEVADWPDEAFWAHWGLPLLPMGEEVNGTVHISDKDWIYPLNGSDGILVEAKPESSRIDEILDAISEAGIEMEEDPDYEKGYTGYYTLDGKDMKATVSETGLGKLTVLIVENPTD